MFAARRIPEDRYLKKTPIHFTTVCGVKYEGGVFKAAHSTTVIIFGVDPILVWMQIFCRDLNMIAVRNPMFEKKKNPKNKIQKENNDEDTCYENNENAK
jgi:hypothetical protein